jgi:hypothetical protein
MAQGLGPRSFRKAGGSDLRQAVIHRVTTFRQHGLKLTIQSPVPVDERRERSRHKIHPVHRRPAGLARQRHLHRVVQRKPDLVARIGSKTGYVGGVIRADIILVPEFMKLSVRHHLRPDAEVADIGAHQKVTHPPDRHAGRCRRVHSRGAAR